ncbi:MAG TPA: restriction endonuclease [Propionibacteriaceae bacterium]
MLDFTELPRDGNAFELMVRELAFELGYHVEWSGQGADGGRDLTIIEQGDTLFGSKLRRWLISCKHNAGSGTAVGRGSLGEIRDLLDQHRADGYLLACTTHPSSAAVDRLRELDGRGIPCHYWDAIQLERMLSTPRTWTIAQRFLPESAGRAGWRVWAGRSPNEFVAAHRGYYIELFNRIQTMVHSTGLDFQLSYVDERLDAIERIPLQDGHSLRPRAFYWNEKAGSITWYIDYLFADGFDQPQYTRVELERRLGDGTTTYSDGQRDMVDIVVRRTFPYSDHYDLDHYGFYEPYRPTFSLGARRPRIDSDDSSSLDTPR